VRVSPHADTGKSDGSLGTVLPASFRDPSGRIFIRNREIYRSVHHSYKDNYRALMDSGLYGDLVERDLIIPHEEQPLAGTTADECYVTIKPERVRFISYPYEWCFSQLKAAALATLEIQNLCLTYDMSLKDCSAYNIQFHKGKPVLIDTLSFEQYSEGSPWVAYRQFCQHFLAPLSLMSYKDIRLNQLSRIYIDGCPLDLANKLLPRRSWLSLALVFHIHLHARSQRYFASGIERHNDKQAQEKAPKRRMSRQALLGLIDQLKTAITKLTWKPSGTEWADYYEETNYSDEAFSQKQEIIRRFLQKTAPGTVWDLGANTGVFSRIATGMGIETVAFDIDPAAVEINYLESLKNNDSTILPLLMDLSNPSPGTGWENRERMTLSERGPVDMALALALVHHLAISNNVPLDRIASFFSTICHKLAIEFVPKSDSQVQRLLAAREDVFPDYTQDNFETQFARLFSILESVTLSQSGRVLYLMVRKDQDQ
jgi:hypothetical protein